MLMAKGASPLLVVVFIFLAACTSQASPTPPPAAPTILLVTPGKPPTLPPTWTPIPTPTPSQTPSPTPPPTLTASPSPTQTRAARAICQQFELLGAPAQDAVLAYDDWVAFSWRGAPPDSLIVLSLRNGESETLGQFLPDSGFDGVFDLLNLPKWGNYAWTLSILIESYGEICPQQGRFYREPWWQQPIQNPFNPVFMY